MSALVGVFILWLVYSSSGGRVLYLCVCVSFICAPFPLAVWVEREFQCDRYLATHARYYIREMRIKAYTQLLESYRSVSLVHMAKSFGVGVEFMDR